MRMIGKIVGLCFVSMFATSMVAAGTASAAPYWLVCLPATSGSTATKYSEHQCVKAETGGAWEWSELENTELPVKARSTLTLEDEVVPGTTAAVACSGVEEGKIGPGRTGTITGISEIKCEKGENCSTLEKNAEPVNLPWATELYETEGTIRIALLNSSEGAPGWKVECTVGGIKEKDECTSEGANAAAENKTTPGLLVSVTFPKPNNPKATCTLTKKETGDVLGSSAISLVNGEGLRVQPVVRPMLEFGPPAPGLVPIEPKTLRVDIKNQSETREIEISLNNTRKLPFVLKHTTCPAKTKLAPLELCEDEVTVRTGTRDDFRGELVVSVKNGERASYTLVS